MSPAMTGEPVRVQLRRTKGWRMPANTVKVTRPGPWGNPFCVHPQHVPGRQWLSGAIISVPTAEDAVACFAEMMAVEADPGTRGHALRGSLPTLRGRNLACWCALSAPCHADVLLELANWPVCEEIPSARAKASQEGT